MSFCHHYVQLTDVEMDAVGGQVLLAFENDEKRRRSEICFAGKHGILT